MSGAVPLLYFPARLPPSVVRAGYPTAVVQEPVYRVAVEEPVFRPVVDEAAPIAVVDDRPYKVGIPAAGSWSATKTYTNLVRNPSFEVNLNSAQGTGNVATRESGWSKFGLWSARCARDSPGGSYAENGLYIPSNGVTGFPVEAGVRYTASAWVNVVDWAGAITAPRIYLRFTNGVSQLAQPSSAGVVARGEQFLSVSGVAPAGANNAIVIVLFGGGTGAYFGDFYMDGISLIGGATPPQYFDGDTPGAIWTGTPHNSASQLTVEV